MAFTWAYALTTTFVLLLVAAVVAACFTSPVEKILKDFLTWVDRDLGPWGPVALAVAYIPLTVLAVPASVLTLGGGYLFGLTLGFVADSIGATIGAGAAFLLGRTVGKSLVVSMLKDYPKFRYVAIAIQRSGFKAFIIFSLVISVVLMICVTKVAKSALDKAWAECEDIEGITSSPELLPTDPSADLNPPLII